jgi:CBS domain containing-hemolysin-like protein
MTVAVVAICCVFVLVNGLFVAAEFAMVAAPKTAVEHRSSRGDRLARRLLDILNSPRDQDRYIATSQLGITIASLGLGMYGEHALAEVVAPHLGIVPFIGAAALSGAIAISILTLLHVVFGEIVPKSVALQHAERVALSAYWPMRVTLFVLYPIVRISNGLAVAFLRLIGVRRQENVHEQFYTPEELQLIVEESQESGALRTESGRLLRELFEFGDLTAAQVMTPRVRLIGIPAGASAAETRQLIAAHRHTRYPIFEGDLDHIIGMVHVKDLLRKLVQNEGVRASDARQMPVVPETAALDDVLTTMQRAHAHMALVIDEHGGTAGLISLEDLFDEVVGDIEEGLTDAPGVMPLADGSARVVGTIRLDELGQYFNVPLEHEEVDSVSGLVLARLGRPPVVGDVVGYGRIQLEVTATSGRGVREVKARLLEARAEDER